MSSIIQELEAEQMGKDVPAFGPGDTVVVQVKVKEGDRERLQAFEGVCIAKRNRGLNSAFTVRKISNGVGVERVFQTYSPAVAGIEVKRRGDVRRAKLYYLRGLTGRLRGSRKRSARRPDLVAAGDFRPGLRDKRLLHLRGAAFFVVVDAGWWPLAVPSASAGP